MSPRPARQRVVLAGAMARKPNRAGHAWVFLQWLLGLHHLGHDVIFVDRLEKGEAVDEEGRPCEPDSSVGWRWVQEVMSSTGLAGRAVLVHPNGSAGIDRDELERWTRGALVLDVMGYLGGHPALAGADARVYLDIDPGFPQLWQALDLYDGFDGYDAFVTVGQRIGRPGSWIPTGGTEWLSTLPPVYLPAWPASAPPPAGAFTSVGAWRGANGPIEYEGERYGLRVHSFRPLVDLPSLVPDAQFELALDIDAADDADRRLLLERGWRLVDPARASCHLGSYSTYIEESVGEILVAKDLYVRSKGGWVSDRSACYLATGRAVIAQDTGLSELFDGEEGLLLYDDVDQAARAVDRVRRDPERHGEAARRLAERCFGTEVVIPRLLAAVSP